MFVQSSALQTAADVLTAIISIITKLFMPVPVLSLLIPKGFASFLCRCVGRGISPLRLWLALPQAHIPGLLVKPSGSGKTLQLHGEGRRRFCPEMGFSITQPSPGCFNAPPDCKMDWMLLPCLLRVPTGKSFSALSGALSHPSLSLRGKGFCRGREGSLILPNDLRGG